MTDKLIVTVPKDTKKEVEKKAKKYGISQSSIVNIALTKYFENEKKEDRK